MRRFSLLLLGILVLAVSPTLKAIAQTSEDQDDQRRKAEADADKKKKEKDKQWSIGQAPLPEIKSAGPCPFVKVLYDAARWEEFKDNREATAAVMYTGEIEGIRAAPCTYKKGDPIKLQMAIDFSLGRGPQAGAATKTFPYWVAVTERNKIIIARQNFTFTADFPAGTDRVDHSEILQNITIPRADDKVSGSNFEILLVGFDVTPEMAAFNRDGKRFRANAGQTTTVAAGTAANR